VTTRVLQSAGYQVVAVENGAEAVRVASGDAFALIILDVVMPQMTGREAFQTLRAAQPGARVILTSGYTADIDIADLMQSGAAFLQKPYDPEQLLRMVRRVLDGPV